MIAREWKILEPLRAYCEIKGISVQTADEETVNVWRLRETQQLVSWVRSLDSKVIDAGMVKEWIQHRPEGIWWSLLTEAVDEYSLETANTELPAAHFLDWLAERVGRFGADKPDCCCSQRIGASVQRTRI